MQSVTECSGDARMQENERQVFTFRKKPKIKEFCRFDFQESNPYLKNGKETIQFCLSNLALEPWQNWFQIYMQKWSSIVRSQGKERCVLF